LQQANVTELAQTMLSVSTFSLTNDHQQSFIPLVNSTVDQFLTDHVPTIIHNLFRMVNVLIFRWQTSC